MPLTLEREQYETILIGDSITITVAKTGINRTKLTIDAPRDMRILRGELAPDKPIKRDPDCGQERKAS